MFHNHSTNSRVNRSHKRAPVNSLQWVSIYIWRTSQIFSSDIHQDIQKHKDLHNISANGDLFIGNNNSLNLRSRPELEIPLISNGSVLWNDISYEKENWKICSRSQKNRKGGNLSFAKVEHSNQMWVVQDLNELLSCE